MATVVIGARGQLGTDLLRLLGSDGIPPSHDELDITRIDHVRDALRSLRPERVINAAAYNLVDRAEDEPAVAFAVNALGPRHLALVCAELDVPLVHVSTDHGFGLDAEHRTPYVETDPPGPLSAYATSKLTGEYFVRSLCPRHFVVRTCGLYGTPSARGKGNFVQTMLRLGREKGRVSVVDDQFCTPTSTANLARAIIGLAATDAYGLYHATNAGETTWCRFAREIYRLAGMEVEVTAITTAEFGAKARRPAYSVLDCTKLTRTIDWSLPAWEQALAAYLAGAEL